MARKLYEYTDGSHAYMIVRLKNLRKEEIDVYFHPDGNHTYITSADHWPENHPPELRQQIIDAFHALY